MERAVIGETSEVWIFRHRVFDVALGVPLNGETLFGNLVAAITARAPELGDANQFGSSNKRRIGKRVISSPRC
jgi:hypothetical protein